MAAAKPIFDTRDVNLRLLRGGSGEVCPDETRIERLDGLGRAFP